MAYRRRYRRRSRRRRSRRFRRRRRMRRKPQSMRVSIKRMPTLFPDNVLVKMHFLDYADVTLANGGAFQESVTFSLNNPGAPNITIGSSLQPMGWDQWSAFYNDCTCYSSSITVTTISENSVGYVMYLGPDGNALAPSYQAAGSLPYYRNRSMTGLFTQTRALKNRASVKALQGRRIGSEQNYSFQMANPTTLETEYFWQLLYINPFDITMRLSAKVHIVYYCRLSGRRLNLVTSG